MVSVAQVRAVTGRGLEGDRYFHGRGSFSRWPGEGRDVTFVELEAIDAILRDHGVDLHEGRSRRNIVTAGGSLAARSVSAGRWSGGRGSAPRAGTWSGSCRPN